MRYAKAPNIPTVTEPIVYDIDTDCDHEWWLDATESHYVSYIWCEVKPDEGRIYVDSSGEKDWDVETTWSAFECQACGLQIPVEDFPLYVEWT